MNTEYTTLWVCPTCRYALEYGPNEALPLASEQRCKTYGARIEYELGRFDNVTNGLMFGEEDCEHTHDNWNNYEEHTLTCERIEHSTMKCDACRNRAPSHDGTPDAGGDGTRYAMTGWVEA